ncbi:MAG: radical SAM protein, partial [Synergistaceae bacterium]|nr:radical SAM protein [Synergistaceae bacterium]
MLFHQTDDSFIRIYDDIGYISNQLSKTDRVYDDIGSVFLGQLQRRPRDFEDAVKELASYFKNTNTDGIRYDFGEFLSDLENDGFIVTGESKDELDSKAPRFSYSDPLSKTLPQTRYETNGGHPDTSEFLYDYFKQNPKIFSFQMELTSRCNEKCRHCYLPGARDMRDMETSLALSLLDQAAEDGTLGLTLSGGECLLHKDFIPILEYARKRDFSISILSNVTLL